MRRVEISDFRKNLKTELDNLPFVLCRYGRIVAMVYAPGDVKGLFNNLSKIKK